jgi:hypothetical protein
VKAFPYSFDQPERLREALQGTEVLVNTDWVRHHRETVGRRYTSELARRLDRQSAYRAN